MALFGELKRRNVIRVAVLYGVASWALLQVGDLLFGALGVPPWGIRLLLGLLLLGFPLALIFAWVYELTPEGLKLERDVSRDASITTQTARKLDVLTIALLVIVVGLVLADRYVDRRRDGPMTTATSASASRPATARSAMATTAVSIAVLPFVNMSDDKSNEYFSDGLTEELLNVLANVPGLRVIARTSSFSYKGKEVKISDVARDLNVDHVLEGSVRKVGQRVRITAQLVRASDSSHVWSETFDRNLDDVFAMQDEISGQVADALKVRLLKQGTDAPETGGTRVAAAYDAYLRGKYFKNQGEVEDDLRKSLAAYDEAIRLDPKYALAYVGRCDTLTRIAADGYAPFDSTFREAKQAVLRAMDLAPDLAEAYPSLANILSVYDFDQEGALAATNRALQLNPGSFDVQYNYSQLMSAFAHHQSAVDAARRATELDPLSPNAQITLAMAYFYARRNTEAETAARHALALEPGRTLVHGTLAWSLLGQERLDEAFKEFDQERVGWLRMTGRALIYAMQGKPDLARAEMEAMHKQLGDASSFQYAQIHAQLGDADAAFGALETARRVYDPGLQGTLVDPMLDPIRHDPRFDAFLRTIGFDPRMAIVQN
jgi:TolB-like protein